MTAMMRSPAEREEASGSVVDAKRHGKRVTLLLWLLGTTTLHFACRPKLNDESPSHEPSAAGDAAASVAPGNAEVPPMDAGVAKRDAAEGPGAAADATVSRSFSAEERLQAQSVTRLARVDRCWIYAKGSTKIEATDRCSCEPLELSAPANVHLLACRGTRETNLDDIPSVGFISIYAVKARTLTLALELLNAGGARRMVSKSKDAERKSKDSERAGPNYQFGASSHGLLRKMPFPSDCV